MTLSSTTERQPFTDAADRYRAVLTRDRSADGHFVFAVLTTGVYCRPGCPSRTPRVENIRFFATAAEAARAGYRACKRCTPDRAVSPGRGQADRMAALCRQLDESETMPTVRALAASAGMSVFHFQRVFKAVTGSTPKQYMMARRAERFRRCLTTAGTVTQAIYDAGFGAASRAYAQAGEHLGMTPGAYRRGGDGASMRYAIVPGPLGWMLVAATERGIAAIGFADDEATLKAELEERFPRARLAPGDASFTGWVEAVIALIETPGESSPPPLDMRGTAFQQRVWQALMDIPPGQTASYAELAVRIGQPHAARAVGRACASNPLAVAVPCHRAVGTDGSLRGYRWGVERKRALLIRERKTTSQT